MNAPDSSGPDLYAVFGNPIAHSKSPRIHALFAAQTDQHLVYEKRLAPLDGFAASVQEFIAAGGRGANVTVPFKLQAHDLADTLAPRAQAAGAVNTLIFADGQVYGDNTDGQGLVSDIVHRAGQPINGQRVLVLGAGGATRGALLPLLEQRPQQLTLANRTLSTAQELLTRFSAQFPEAGRGVTLHACGLSDIQGQFDLVINATSASLQAAIPPIPENCFANGALAYDMVYGKELTPFLQYAQQHGARARDGLGMLVEQAALAFFLWRKVKPDSDAVYHTLLSEL